MTPKTVLITGASSGIGLATGQMLAARGHRVFGTSRTPDLKAVTEFELLPVDVRDQALVEACVTEVLQRAGKLDVLINNAGYGLIGFLEETSIAEAQAIFDTNFFGVVRMTNAVLPHVVQKGVGSRCAKHPAGRSGNDSRPLFEPSAKEVMQSDQLRLMARELAEMVKKMPKLDWTQRESVRADLRRNVRRLLAKYGYPPDLSEDATQLVLKQAELSTEAGA